MAAAKSRIVFVSGDTLDVVETIAQLTAVNYPSTLIGATSGTPSTSPVTIAASGKVSWVNLRNVARIDAL